MMTEELQRDFEDLDAMSKDLAQAVRSPFEPHCVARVFSRPLRGTVSFTMQMWIDLSAIRSPLLNGGRLEERADLAAAAEIFDLLLGEYVGEQLVPFTAEQEAITARAIEEAVARAFAMGLKMKPPGDSQTVDDQGFGDWLSVNVCLMTELHMRKDEARATEVGEALALINGLRGNQGWIVTGEGYRDRDLADQVPAEAAKNGR